MEYFFINEGQKRNKNIKKIIKIHEHPIEVETNEGIGILKDLILTDLGYLQARICFINNDSEINENNKKIKKNNSVKFIKYFIGELDQLLCNAGIKIIKK